MVARRSSGGDAHLIRVVCILAPAAALASLTMKVPYFADDFCRYTADLVFQDVLDYVVYQYQNWSGRYTIDFTAALVLKSGAPGKVAYAVVNGLCLGVILWYALRISRVPDEATAGTGPSEGPREGLLVDPCVVSLFLCLFWFTPDRFGEAVLWATGSVLYFWPMALLLFLLTPLLTFAQQLIAKDPVVAAAPSPAYRILYCLVAFVGGGCLETVSVAVAAVWAAILVLARTGRRRPIPPCLLHGFAAWVVGSVLLIAAPGNYARAQLVGDPYDLTTKILHVVGRLWVHLDLLVLGAGAALLILTWYLRPRASRGRLLQALIIAAIATGTVLAMVGAPLESFQPRTAFPYQFLLILVVLSIFPREALLHPPPGPGRRAVRPLLVGVCILAFGITVRYFVTVDGVYARVMEQERVREGIMDLAREAGEAEVVLPPLIYTSEYHTLQGTVSYGPYFAIDVLLDAEHWINRCYARAHDVPAVVLGVPKDRAELDRLLLPQ